MFQDLQDLKGGPGQPGDFRRHDGVAFTGLADQFPDTPLFPVLFAGDGVFYKLQIGDAMLVGVFQHAVFLVLDVLGIGGDPQVSVVWHGDLLLSPVNDGGGDAQFFQYLDGAVDAGEVPDIVPAGREREGLAVAPLKADGPFPGLHHRRGDDDALDVVGFQQQGDLV